MTPQEIAMKLSGAYGTCKNGKCPYTAECQGSKETCKMAEVAMTIRALLAEIETLKVRYGTVQKWLIATSDYVKELERINSYYYKIVSEYQNGYIRRSKIQKRKPHIGSARGRKPKKKSLIEMDGDERYAMPEEPKPPKDPVVII